MSILGSDTGGYVFIFRFYLLEKRFFFFIGYWFEIIISGSL